MTVDEANALFARREKAFAERDVAALVADYADDCIVESPTALGTMMGRAAAEQRYRQLFAAVPDIRIERHHLVVMGDQVVTVVTVSGTGSALGLGAGKPFSLPLVSLYTFRADKIVRHRRLTDSSGLLLQRIEQELKAAADVQQRLLPPNRYAGAGFEIAAASMPCRAIGGDFFDYFADLGDSFGFALGDVAGKGPPAALLSATVQAILGVHAQARPAATLGQVNRALLRRAIPSRFTTAVYGTLTGDGRLAYCNAGHNPPYLVSRDGCRELRVGGSVLGMFEEATFEEETVQLANGDLVVVFSDGITEAVNADGIEFTETRLLSCIEASRDLEPTALVSRIFDEVRAFTGSAAQSDDMTLLVLRYGTTSRA